MWCPADIRVGSRTGDLEAGHRAAAILHLAAICARRPRAWPQRSANIGCVRAGASPSHGLCCSGPAHPHQRLRRVLKRGRQKNSRPWMPAAAPSVFIPLPRPSMAKPARKPAPKNQAQSPAAWSHPETFTPRCRSPLGGDEFSWCRLVASLVSGRRKAPLSRLRDGPKALAPRPSGHCAGEVAALAGAGQGEPRVRCLQGWRSEIPSHRDVPCRTGSRSSGGRV